MAVNDHYALANVEVPAAIQFLKREAIMFNRIGIQYLKQVYLSNESIAREHSTLVRDVEWLLEKDIVFEAKRDLALEIKGDEREQSYHLVSRYASDLTGLRRDPEFPLSEGENLEILKRVMRLASSITRDLCIQLRELTGMDAYPILPAYAPAFEGTRVSKHDILMITLNAVPFPDESISWEQILEYRSDPDSQSKFLALRHWMSEVARAELTPAEVEEKLEYLIDQYQKHMRLHRMKTNVGTLETVVTTTAEVLGDLASFKWGKAAGALFSLRRRRVALLEGELTAPGSEVAYIVKARETFS